MEKNKVVQIKWNMDVLRKTFSILICMLAVGQFVMIFTCNLLKANEIVNWDTSAMLRHGMEMWKNHAIFIEGFFYGTSLEIDTPAFLFLPIYFLSKSLGLALAVGFAVLYVVDLLICRDIFGNLGKDRIVGVIATIFLFTPYSLGELDWAKMLFIVGGQYSFRVMSLLLVIDALLCWEGNNSRKKNVFVSICSLLVVFWTSLSCGNYVIMVVLLPIVLWFVFKGIEAGSFRFNLNQGIVLGGICMLAIAGWLIHDALAGSVVSSANNVITASEFIVNTENCITGLLMLFGGLTDAAVFPVFSVVGILLILRCALPFLCIGLLIFNLIRTRKISTLCFMFVFVALVNISVLIFTHTRYGAIYFEHRYHIIWVVSLFICVAELWSEFKESRYELIFMAGLLFVLYALNGSGYKHVMEETDSSEVVRNVIAVSDELDCDTVFWYNERQYPRQFRALAPDKYSIYTNYGEGSESSLIENLYYDYPDRSFAGNRNILVIEEKNVDQVLEQFPQYQYDRTLASGWRIYVSDTNPWDGMSGLPYGKRTAIDFPYSAGYHCTGTPMDGGVVMSGNLQDVLSGPGSEAFAGTYDIVLEFKDLGKESPMGSLVITVDDEEVICEGILGVDGKFSVENVEIPAGEKFDITIYANQGKWLLKKIMYTRK